MQEEMKSTQNGKQAGKYEKKTENNQVVIDSKPKEKKLYFKCPL